MFLVADKLGWGVVRNKFFARKFLFPQIFTPRTISVINDENYIKYSKKIHIIVIKILI